MGSKPEVKVFPNGLREEFPDGPPTTVITYRGYQVVLRFAAGDITGAGDVQELRLLPVGTDALEPRVLRRLAPDAELYLDYARKAMRIFGPEGTPEERWQGLGDAAEALRGIAGPGRGLPPGFYRMIGGEYDAIVDGGEPHPVKTIAERRHVTISAASRWVKGARERGHISTPPPGKGGAGG